MKSIQGKSVMARQLCVLLLLDVILVALGSVALVGCDGQSLNKLQKLRVEYFKSLEGVFPCVEYVDNWYAVIADPDNPFASPEFPTPSAGWDDTLDFYTCMYAQAEEALASLDQFRPEGMVKDDANRELAGIRDQLVALFQVGNLFSKQWRVCSPSRYSTMECETVQEVMYGIGYRIGNVYDEIYPLTSVDHTYIRSNLSEAKDEMRRYAKELSDAITFFEWRMKEPIDWEMDAGIYRSNLSSNLVEWPECLELFDEADVGAMNLQSGVRPSSNGETTYFFKRLRGYHGGIAFVAPDGDFIRIMECMRAYSEWLAWDLATHDPDKMSVNDEDDKFEDLHWLNSDVYSLQRLCFKHWNEMAKQNLTRSRYEELESLLSEHDEAFGDCVQLRDERDWEAMLRGILVYQRKVDILLFRLEDR